MACFTLTCLLLFPQAGLDLFLMYLMIQLQQALQYFLSGLRGDGEAGAVVFGEIVYFVEIMGKGDVCPAVGKEDGVVHLHMEFTEFEDVVITFLADG